MGEKLFQYMQWPEIEAIVYSEHDRPKQILGTHETKDGVVVQAFFPGAQSVRVESDSLKEPVMMEKVDENGYFAALIPDLDVYDYLYRVTEGDGHSFSCRDAYAFETTIQDEDIRKFQAGIHYEIYKVLGAHSMTLHGVPGVRFAVWAPSAMRVSVVGDFNQWDGRRHPMQRIDGGIHELFIPGLKPGDIYKYEVKVKNGDVMLKTDPYGTQGQMRPDNASVICDVDGVYEWKDKEWMRSRRRKDLQKEPVFIYELHLGGFERPDEDDGRTFYNYRELAEKVADYVTQMGYTHIELMPVMEHPLDESWGYQVTGYYAPTSRYGTPEDLMYFIDYMHQKGIGVILDWVPAHFPRDLNGLAKFDGTPLYEYPDPRRGEHPHWGTLIFNYGRHEVSNFLIANAMYWVEEYHADGLRFDAVASMLYLDYGRNDGEWVANMYGGKEHLEAIEFLKHLNSMMKKRNPDVAMIAEESTAWPKVTAPVEDEGLGFDYKWNMGWMNDFLGFMQLDPLFRKGAYGNLLFSMIYAYSEKFILVLSHDEVVHGKGSMIGKMPGTYEEKFANLRLAYGFMTAHPGKKLLFMGQDFAQFTEFNEAKSLEWFMLEYEAHRQMQNYVKDLLKLYKEYPALYRLDHDPDGFEWINNISADETIVVFLRKNRKRDETLLVVCNFTPVVRKNYKIGVPFEGKYKEIFNSDAKVYGGEGNVNPRVKPSKEDECDERENSIRITVPPLGISIFRCTPEKLKKPGRGKKAAAEKKKPEKKTVDDSQKKPEKKTANDSQMKSGKKAADDGQKKPVKISVMKKETAPAKAIRRQVEKLSSKRVPKSSEDK